MTDTVYSAMLVAIKAMTRIAAEVGRGFAGIVRQKALADLTSCDYVIVRCRGRFHGFASLLLFLLSSFMVALLLMPFPSPLLFILFYHGHGLFCGEGSIFDHHHQCLPVLVAHGDIIMRLVLVFLPRPSDTHVPEKSPQGGCFLHLVSILSISTGS